MKIRDLLQKRIATAVWITLVLIGCAVGMSKLVDWLDRWEQAEISNWPTAVGTVVSAELKTRGTSYDNEYTALDVRFTYIVNGKSYSSSQDFNEEAGREYPEGSRVIVHHSPKKPSISFIDPVRFIGLVFWIGMASTYLLVGEIILFVYTWVWALRK